MNLLVHTYIYMAMIVANNICKVLTIIILSLSKAIVELGNKKID